MCSSGCLSLLFMTEIFCCCPSYSSFLHLVISTFHIVAGPHFHLNLTASLALCSCVVRLKGGYRALQVTAFLFVPVPTPLNLSKHQCSRETWHSERFCAFLWHMPISRGKQAIMLQHFITWVRTTIVETLNLHTDQHCVCIRWCTHHSSFILPYIFFRLTIRTDQPCPPVLQGYRRVVVHDLSDPLMSTRPAPRWWWFPSSSCLSLAPLRATSSPLDRLVHSSNHQFFKMTYCTYYRCTKHLAHIIQSACSSYYHTSQNIRQYFFVFTKLPLKGRRHFCVDSCRWRVYLLLQSDLITLMLLPGLFVALMLPIIKPVWY